MPDAGLLVVPEPLPLPLVLVFAEVSAPKYPGGAVAAAREVTLPRTRSDVFCCLVPSANLLRSSSSALTAA